MSDHSAPRPSMASSAPLPSVAEVRRRNDQLLEIVRTLGFSIAELAELTGLDAATIGDGLREASELQQGRGGSAPDPAEADEDLDADEPDDSLEVIDTRPGRPIPPGRWSRRKMPLLRASHTLCHPGDNWPCSVEMVVLAGEAEGDRTAAKEDLAELQLAGWQDYEFGPLKIFLRVVVA